MMESEGPTLTEADFDSLIVQLEDVYKSAGKNRDPRHGDVRLVGELAGVKDRKIDIHGFTLVLDKTPDEHTSFVISKNRDTSWIAQTPWLNGWPTGARAVLVTSISSGNEIPRNTSYKVAPATLADLARVRNLLTPAGKT